MKTYYQYLQLSESPKFNYEKLSQEHSELNLSYEAVKKAMQRMRKKQSVILESEDTYERKLSSAAPQSNEACLEVQSKSSSQRTCIGDDFNDCRHLTYSEYCKMYLLRT